VRFSAALLRSVRVTTLAELGLERPETRVLLCAGLDEPGVMRLLGDLARPGSGLGSRTIEVDGVVRLALFPDPDAPRTRGCADIGAAAQEARRRLGGRVFGEGDATLAQALVHALASTRRTIAVVESCTGGMIGAAVTDVPGASDVFVGGWITYCDAMKEREVDVPRAVFAPSGCAPGAVSRECAEAMARGGVRRSGADLCIAVTGIAGPSGGSAEKPVGTVWIALAECAGQTDLPDVDARRFRLTGDRAAVRRRSVNMALALAWLRATGLGSEPVAGQVEG
jgi:nicotinamide-nucleotide amidase